jgi:hypothetical protein
MLGDVEDAEAPMGKGGPPAAKIFGQPKPGAVGPPMPQGVASGGKAIDVEGVTSRHESHESAHL